MSSANEELQPQPKPRASPLDFRNTDLVSRLLAATPPYLYNMPIVPNSYFFSEMLRSFVQAKTDNATRIPGTPHQRRPRKRSWTQARAEYYHRDSPKSPPKPEVNLNDSFASPERLTYDNKRLIERPLELTMGKIALNNNNNSSSTKVNENDTKLMTMAPTNSHYALDKQELPASITQTNHAPLMFPAVPQNLNQESTHPNLMLPPPPPIWYPPLYPPPYGFDPLHFFIDLRVSGHIYDRKNDKDNTNSNSAPSHTTTQHEEIPESHHNNKFQTELNDVFKQSRHMSAFSVPVPTPAKNIPMNLSNSSRESDSRERKFDVKSMGFETTRNATGTNYIMNNVGRIYKDLRACKIENCVALQDSSDKENGEEKREETEEEKEKRVKDLRALIGLELVVDYMNQAKPGRGRGESEESSTDIESADSPSVEVVACTEEF